MWNLLKGYWSESKYKRETGHMNRVFLLFKEIGPTLSQPSLSMATALRPCASPRKRGGPNPCDRHVTGIGEIRCISLLLDALRVDCGA